MLRRALGWPLGMVWNGKTGLLTMALDGVMVGVTSRCRGTRIDVSGQNGLFAGLSICLFDVE